MRNSIIKLVLITVPNAEIAANISRTLVEKKLAACIQTVSGISSMYWWKGKIEKENEILLMVKTVSEKLTELEKVVTSLHPYEIPEIIVIDIPQASEAYLNWVKETTSSS